MTKPIFSIITPIYNGANFVERCYRNMLSQTFQNWEWVVVDDGSTDDTARIVRSLNDERVRLISYNINKGRGHARNLAISESTGDWIVIWDVDDLNFPERFEEIEKARRLNYDFFCSYAVVVNNDMDIKGTRGFHEHSGCLPRQFVHPTLAFKKSIAEKIKYKITKGTGGPAEDARVIWSLSLTCKGLWFEDALAIYFEDRDVHLGKAIDTNKAHLQTIRELNREGLIKDGLIYRLTVMKYALKILLLTLMQVYPKSYPRMVAFRDYGQLKNGWKLSPEKTDFIKNIKTVK